MQAFWRRARAFLGAVWRVVSVVLVVTAAVVLPVMVPPPVPRPRFEQALRRDDDKDPVP